jgi:predicted ATPase
MITTLYANGFKSLSKFRMNFRKGLNVLIGPNGAGKTNICQAIGLVASAAEGKLSEYVLSLGGAHSTFRITAKSTLKKPKHQMLVIKCSGCTSGIFEKENIPVHYNYFLKLSLEDNLKVSSERLHISRDTEDDQPKATILVNRRKPDKIEISLKNVKRLGPVAAFIQDGKEKILFDVSLDLTQSILEPLSALFFAVHIVRQDLRASRSWNIDPHLAKKPTDLADPPTMLGDGRRLANAIHALFAKNDNRTRDINDFLVKVYPNFKQLDPKTSAEGSTRSFSITDKFNVPCPANCLSDGTVKALALLVGILGRKHNTIIIEEPENYIHPWAAQALVEFLRDNFADRACILTTHSETILNAIKPREIIVCDASQGYTVGRRLYKTKALEDAISRSGFGCGYHYLTGELGGTPQ